MGGGLGRNGDQDMNEAYDQSPHSTEVFVERLRREGAAGTMTIIPSTGSCTMEI